MENKKINSYIFTMAVLFFSSIVMGYFIATRNINEAGKIVGELSSTLGFIKDLNPFLIFLFIFINNSVKSLLMVLLGFFFGLIPLIFIITNGYMLGVVIAVTQLKIGMSAVLISLIPHGIFEIPAVLIASGYGMLLGYKFFRKLFFKEPFEAHLKLSLNKFWKIVVPLLFLAALIETFFTPYLLSRLNF